MGTRWCPAGAVLGGRPAGWAPAGGKPPMGRGFMALVCLWSCSCVVLGTAEQCPCLCLAPRALTELPAGAVPGGHPLARSGVYEHTLMLVSASLGILGPASPHRALPCLAAPWCPCQASPLMPSHPAAGGKAERGAIKGSTSRRLLPPRLAPGPVFGLLKTCLQLVSSR